MSDLRTILEELRQRNSSQWISAGPAFQRDLDLVHQALRVVDGPLVSLKAPPSQQMEEVRLEIEAAGVALMSTPVWSLNEAQRANAEAAVGHLNRAYTLCSPQADHQMSPEEAPADLAARVATEVGRGSLVVGNGQLEVREHLGAWRLSIGLRHAHADRTILRFLDEGLAQEAIAALRKAEVDT